MAANILKNTFSSLHSKNFRYFWFGQFISVIGTWIQRTAQTWLVYQMTNSALLVGVLAACQFIPIIFLTLIAGTVIDRHPKRQILILTQFGFLLLGLAMTLLVFFKVVQYWQILIIALATGVLQSFDTPTRQSFVFELVGPKNLLNGISLNSSIFNLAKIIGPSIAGILITSVSMAACFLINTLSFLAVLIGLFFIDNIPANVKSKKATVLKDVKEGINYIVHHDSIKLSAELMMIICTLNFNNNVIIPVYAKTVLHGGAQTFATLQSAVGIGSLIAALVMGYLSRFGSNRKLYLGVSFGTVILQSSMIFVKAFSIALVIMILIGFCNMVFLNQSNASFQYSIPNELRGRIMSVYVLLNQGSTPIGSVYVGAIMDIFSGLFGFPACGLLALILLVPLTIKHKELISQWISGKEPLINAH